LNAIRAQDDSKLAHAHERLLDADRGATTRFEDRATQLCDPSALSN
jgi:hypothetical protein